MRKRNPITLLTIICMLAVLLSACAGNGGSNAPKETSPASTNSGGKTDAESTSKPEEDVYPENGLPKNEKVTLKVGFANQGMGKEWFDAAVESFQKKFPNVKLDITSSPDIAKITSTKIAAGDDDMFDMFSGGIPGGNAALNSLVDAGKLEPVEHLWDRELYDKPGTTLKDISLEGQFEGTTRILDQTYSLPIAGTGAGLFFDKKLFEEKGWNSNPKTWTEFTDLLAAIKADGLIPITYPGVYPGYISNSFGPWSLFHIAMMNDNLDTFTKQFREYANPYYTSDEMIDMWNRIYELGKKGYFPKGVSALNHTQSQMQVLQRQAALASNGSWIGNEMKNATPEGFEWGFMAVPFGEDPDQTFVIRNSTGNGFHIWANKPELNKKWAMEFSLWLWNMDVQELIAEKGGMLPVRKDFTEDAARADKLQNAPKAMFEFIDNNKVLMESGFHTVTLTDPAFQQANKLYTDSINEIAEGTKDPVPMLEEAEKLMEKARQAQQ
ncbi:extracellular solute-binding protein [Paenibacillus sp. J5C_2022]|uniref:extracellular solute-binding protein n=1 Tax=Paenibacillus sp. J5C2022 TaxID=2977129 RepID=UPI0021CF5411|nr:extracellular solute-binding protein [Paenibacillus sp. J5C2022]MCU6712152.1 extracellular solute-binding protein [Paenibacillus sp. J5C2022]